MVYLIALILIAIIGGPLLVAASIALFGAWMAFVWTVVGAALGLAVFTFAGMWIWSGVQAKRNQGLRSAFGQPLSQAFKQRHRVEDGIYKDEFSFVVEINGRPKYCYSIEEARSALNARPG